VPIAKPDTARTPRGVPIVIAVLANDEGGGLTVSGYTQPIAGTLALNPDQTFTYTPAASFEGVDGFTYTIRDGVGGTSEGEVRIFVARPNRAPLPANDSAAIVLGSAATIPVLANDNDPDGDPVEIIGIDAPAHGTITVQPDGAIRYVPQADFAGIDSFTYTLGDGQGATAEASVTVTVSLPNQPPMARADRATTVEGTAVTIDALANDNDPDGNPLSLAGMEMPGHGSLALTPENRFTYTPRPGFVGTDSFSYTVRDDAGATARADVVVEVTAHNAAPTAVPDSLASSGQAVTFDPLANDSDPDGDALQLKSLTMPLRGRVEVANDGRVTYTPPAGFTGTDEFTYQVGDGTEVSEAGVSVAITAPAIPTYANGYRHRRRIVVPVQASTAEVAADFVLLVRESGTWLKPASAGGRVEHPQGFDLRLELEDGTRLDHDLERYDGAAGSLVAWVRVPSYQLASQLRLFLYYGKPGLTVTEANPSAAWRGYLAVIDSRTGADRTGNGRSLTPSGINAGELIGPAGSYNGSAIASRSDAAFLSGLGALTVQAVVQADATMIASDHGILAQGPMNGTDAAAGVTLQYLARAADGTANVVQFKLNCTDGGAFVLSAAQAQSSSRQVMHGVWRQGAAARLFLNGDEAEPSTAPTARAGLSAMPAGGLYLGAGARDPATGGWRGLIDDVRIAAVALTPARVAAEAANLATAQALYGLGGEDAAGESDAAPAAVPVRANATSGGSVDVDVLTSVYDPDGPLPISVTGVGTARNGVVTVVSGKVRYTPFAGFIGTDDFTYTVKSGSKRSDSVVTVTVVAPASASELPTARRTINVGSAAQLTAALGGNFTGLVTTPASVSGPLVAGDHIVLADGTYGGSFALARSGTAPTDSNRNGVPIVVRAANLLGARFTGKFNVSGANGWLYGLDFDGQNANGAIGSNLGGDHSRLMRCRYRRHRTAADVRMVMEKHGGNLGTSGAVAWMFDRKGRFVLGDAPDRAAEDDANAALRGDQLLELVLEVGADDLVEDGDEATILCGAVAFADVQRALAERDVPLRTAELAYVPTQRITVADPAVAIRLVKLIDDLEDNDDVQTVFSNEEFTDDVQKALEEA